MRAEKGDTKRCEHNAIFIGRTSVKRLLIFTAVRAEAKAVADAFGARLPRATGPVTLRAGELEVELHVVGIGAAKLPTGLSPATVSGIIMAGLAGALDPKLQI